MPSGGSCARKSDRIYKDITADLVTRCFTQREIARHYRVSNLFVSVLSANLEVYSEPIKPVLAVNRCLQKVTYNIKCGLHDLLDKYKTVQLNKVTNFVRDKYNVEITKLTM